MKRENLLIISATYGRGFENGSYNFEVKYGKHIWESSFSNISSNPIFNCGTAFALGPESKIFDNQLFIKVYKKKTVGGSSFYGDVQLNLAECISGPKFPIIRNVVNKNGIVGQILLRGQILADFEDFLPPVENSTKGIKPIGLLVYVPLCNVDIENLMERTAYAEIQVGKFKDVTENYIGKESPAWFTKFFYEGDSIVPEDKITVTIYKKKHFGSDCLGSVQVPLQALLNGCKYEKDIQILNKKGHNTGFSVRVLGQLIYPSTYTVPPQDVMERPHSYNPSIPAPIPASIPAPQYIPNPSYPPMQFQPQFIPQPIYPSVQPQYIPSQPQPLFPPIQPQYTQPPPMPTQPQYTQPPMQPQYTQPPPMPSQPQGIFPSMNGVYNPYQ
ncbi:hypothetical protein WA158_002007 [Blastocystis sp. Blastoise]